MIRKRVIALCVCLSLAAGAAGCKKDSEETAGTSSSGTSSEIQTEPSGTTDEESGMTTETTVETETEAETSETTEMFILGDDGFLPEYETFELSSEDLTDGVWADVISNTSVGENLSPQLSWESVDGASCYVIYMIDLSASYWGHWKTDTVDETELARGASAGMAYVGPYPPSGGPHTYDIYVVALRNPVERLMGVVNNQNPNFASFIRGLDTDAEGNDGNIIAYGHLSGEFTSPAAS